MLEKDEGFLPGLILDALDPGAEVLITVVLTAQTKVAPGRGGHEGNAQLGVGIVNAKGGVVLPENGIDLVVEPGLVPELQRGLPIAGQQAEKIAQDSEILAKEGWELEEQRAAFLAQRCRGLHKVGDVIAYILQSLIVRDTARHLEHEGEVVGNLRGPVR